METMPAREAKNSFGLLLDTAQREPVTIEKKGRAVAVVVSKHDYDALQRELQDLRSERETAFLLRGKNGDRLRASIASVERGDVVPRTIQELDELARDDA